MRHFITIFCIAFLLFSNSTFGQTEKQTREFSLVFSNGMSNYLYLGIDGEEGKVAYVNSLRLQMAFGKSDRYKFVLGLQYGAYGSQSDWVCNSGFCDQYGVPPIQFKTINRFRLATLIFNPRFSFSKKYYVQGGLSLDIPFAESFKSTYESSDGLKGENSDLEFKGDKALFNTTLGANLIFGKQFTINEKWNWMLEIEGKLYNFITVRFEDFEGYFLEKREKPWVIGINLGMGLN